MAFKCQILTFYAFLFPAHIFTQLRTIMGNKDTKSHQDSFGKDSLNLPFPEYGL